MKLRLVILIWFAAVNTVNAQQGPMEYGPTYDGFIRTSDSLANVLSGLQTMEDFQQQLPDVQLAVRNALKEVCALEAEGIPVVGDEMHPDDYAYTGGDEPSQLGLQEARLIQIDNNLANQYFELFDIGCDEI